MEHSQGDFIEMRICAETAEPFGQLATWAKGRIGRTVQDGFYSVYGYDSDGKFFDVSRVEPDRVRVCEACREAWRDSICCEEHRRLIQ